MQTSCRSCTSQIPQEPTRHGRYARRLSPLIFPAKLAANHPRLLQAYAIGGRNEKAVQEFLEKNWTASLADQDSLRLTVKALLEVVDSGSKNMEVAILKYGQPVRMISDEELQSIIADIEREQEEAKKSKEDMGGDA